MDSEESKVTLVVDEQLLGEEEYRRDENKYRPANFSLVLGFDRYGDMMYGGGFQPGQKLVPATLVQPTYLLASPGLAREDVARVSSLMADRQEELTRALQD